MTAIERIIARVKLTWKQYLCEHDWGIVFAGKRTCNRCGLIERVERRWYP